MKFYKTSSLKKIINNCSDNYFLVELIYFGIQKNYKIKNFEIKTKKNINNSKIGFGLKTQLKIINALKFLF